MSLLLQLNGDLPEQFPGHERRLYVFCCKRKTCRRKDGSVRSFRGSRVAKVKAPENKREPSSSQVSSPPVDIGATLFGATAGDKARSNPFFSNAQSTTANPFGSSSG